MLTTKYDSPSTQITEADDFSFVLISKVNKPQDSATIGILLSRNLSKLAKLPAMESPSFRVPSGQNKMQRPEWPLPSFKLPGRQILRSGDLSSDEEDDNNILGEPSSPIQLRGGHITPQSRKPSRVPSRQKKMQRPEYRSLPMCKMPGRQMLRSSDLSSDEEDHNNMLGVPSSTRQLRGGHITPQSLKPSRVPSRQKKMQRPEYRSLPMCKMPGRQILRSSDLSSDEEDHNNMLGEPSSTRQLRGGHITLQSRKPSRVPSRQNKMQRPEYRSLPMFKMPGRQILRSSNLSSDEEDDKNMLGEPSSTRQLRGGHITLQSRKPSRVPSRQNKMQRPEYKPLPMPWPSRTVTEYPSQPWKHWSCHSTPHEADWNNMQRPEVGWARHSAITTARQAQTLISNTTKATTRGKAKQANHTLREMAELNGHTIPAKQNNSMEEDEKQSEMSEESPKLKQPQATPGKKAGIVSFNTPGQDTFISGLTAAKKQRKDNGNNGSEDTNLSRMSSTVGKFCQQETAAQYQGGLRTASDEMCTSEATEAAVLCQDRLMMASESCLPGPGRAVPGEGQPEAAIKGQPGLRMASERLCMLPPGHAGGGQPEADQNQGGQRTASEESCLSPGCAALGLWRRSQFMEKAREMDDRKFFIHKMTQMAFLRAKEEFNNNIRTPSDELCMPEAAEVAVLCQGWLMISESFVPPPGRAAPAEGQPEATHKSRLLESCLPTLGRAAIRGQPGLRMASERLCMLPPGHAGGGQPETDQYQGGQRTALEESCLPPGCAALGLKAWRRSQFIIHKMTQTAILKGKEKFNNVRMPSEELCAPEAAEVAVICQGWLMISESFVPPPGRAAPGEGQPEAAHIGGLLESCLPTLGCAAPREGQSEPAQYQGGLRTASEELCLPPGCAAWRRSWLPETSREMDDRNFFVYEMTRMAFVKAKEEFNNNIRTPSEELCVPEAAEVAVICQGWLMISESFVPSPGRAAPGEGQPEAAHIGGLLESCLPTLGCAAPGGGQSEPAQYQGGLRTASEELCLPPGCAAWRRSRLPETSREMDDRNFFVYGMTRMAFVKAKEEFNNNVRTPSDELCAPESAEVAVLCQGWLMSWESCLPPPGPAAPGEGQPEAAHMGELLELCLPTLGHAAPGEGQSEAAQYNGGLRTVSEESCWPPGCVVWRRSRLPGTSSEMDDRKFFIHNMTPMAFLKAKEEFNNNVRTPSDELCTPEVAEVAVLCQAGLRVASESCLPAPRCTVPGEAEIQGQAGLRMTSEKLGMPPGTCWRRTRLSRSLMNSRPTPRSWRRTRPQSRGLCTSEASVLCQAGLRVTSESCLPAPQRTAPGEAEIQGQAGLRMASEKLGMAPGTCWGRTRLSRSLKNNRPTPRSWRRTSPQSRGLCMSEAAVLCQAGLRVALESCLPPGRAAMVEAQYQGGLMMAAEKLCMLPPGHAGGGQPEASQYQGGLRTTSEESCLPPGCAAHSHAAWRRSRLPSKKKRRRRRTSAGTVGSLSCTTKYGCKPRRGQMTNPGLGGGRCQGRKGPIHYYN
jgi:hypothetical protein